MGGCADPVAIRGTISAQGRGHHRSEDGSRGEAHGAMCAKQLDSFLAWLYNYYAKIVQTLFASDNNHGQARRFRPGEARAKARNAVSKSMCDMGKTKGVSADVWISLTGDM